MDRDSLSHRQLMLLNTVRKLVRHGDVPNLDRIFDRVRPVDIAGLFSHLNEWEARRVILELTTSNPAFAAEVVAELDDGLTRSAVAELSKEQLSSLVSDMPSDDAAGLLRLLPEQTATEILPMLQSEKSDTVEEILAYDRDTAGALMSTEHFSLAEDRTVAEAISSLQHAGDSLEMANYLYVVSGAGQLVGVLSLRSLVINPPEKPLREIMITEVLTVGPSTPQREVARMVARYNLLAVPVVDNYNKLLGIVTVDDVIDVIQDEANEDILQLVGAPENDVGGRSIFRSVRTRAPWLFGTLLAGLLASEIIRAFHPTLESLVVLAGFIPVMVGLSGNAGNQAATLTAREVSAADVEPTVLGQTLFRELTVGACLGAASGLILLVFILLRYGGGLALPVAVGLSSSLAILMAVTFGTLSPLILRKLRLDPGFATGPLVSMVVDLLGIAIYFLLSTWLTGILV